MYKRIIKKINRHIGNQKTLVKADPIETYFANGREAWSEGYIVYKEQQIKHVINNVPVLKDFLGKKLPVGYGFRLDERIVEYPWLLSNLSGKQTRFLDAGSTFNFEYLINHEKISKKEIIIYTYFPEPNNFSSKRISYVYGDLREIPFKDQWFDEIVCHSTIEHIDMDNSIYGYDIKNNAAVGNKSYAYLNAIHELLRILKPQGILLLTFPFGKFENHGFFQQFDKDMLDRITDILTKEGVYENTYFRYMPEGWVFCEESDCKNVESFNPHTGRGKGDDGAAHCRSICCIKFVKN